MAKAPLKNKIDKKVNKKQSDDINFNQAMTQPNMTNAIVLERMLGKQVEDLNIYLLADELKKLGNQVNGGDLSVMEHTLVGQITTLQGMFTALVNRAQAQEYMKSFDTYMRLALKAQAQSRATMQTLIELKYPRQVIVAQQANIANQQQVNNHPAPANKNINTSCHTRAAKNKLEQNKLMDVSEKESVTALSSNKKRISQIEQKADLYEYAK